METKRRAYQIAESLISAPFAQRVKESPHGQYLGLGLDIQNRAIDSKARTVAFTASTSTPDRYGDIIQQDGWQLDNYRNNPVVLFSHDSSALPIAKAANIEVATGKLMLLAQFPTKGAHPGADIVFNLIQDGFLNAVSVGFIPLEYSVMETPDGPSGLRFTSAELLEISVVCVPANPEALVATGKSASQTLEKWLEELAACKQADPLDDFLANLKTS